MDGHRSPESHPRALLRVRMQRKQHGRRQHHGGSPRYREGRGREGQGRLGNSDFAALSTLNRPAAFLSAVSASVPCTPITVILTVALESPWPSELFTGWFCRSREPRG